MPRYATGTIAHTNQAEWRYRFVARFPTCPSPKSVSGLRRNAKSNPGKRFVWTALDDVRTARALGYPGLLAGCGLGSKAPRSLPGSHVAFMELIGPVGEKRHEFVGGVRL